MNNRSGEAVMAVVTITFIAVVWVGFLVSFFVKKDDPNNRIYKAKTDVTNIAVVAAAEKINGTR